MKVVVEHFSDSRWSWFNTETDDPDALYRALREDHPEWQTIRISPERAFLKRWMYPMQEVVGDSSMPTLH